MPTRRPRREPLAANPDPPADPAQPTNARLPTRRRGGQELPDDVQDRPEQNAGYDAAVAGDSTATPRDTHEDADVEGGADLHIRPVPDGLPPEDRPVETPDDRAERDVVAEVRRRERRR
jgi:hypothetical protein